jgi:hypothetical protein
VPSIGCPKIRELERDGLLRAISCGILSCGIERVLVGFHSDNTSGAEEDGGNRQHSASGSKIERSSLLHIERLKSFQT